MKEETLEDKILSAAFDVFVEKGYEKAKMLDIAEKAGINRTVLNYYFRSKDILYRKIATKILRQAFPSFVAILNGPLPFEKKIKLFVENYIDTLQNNPFVPLFVINEINSHGDTFIEEMLDGNKPDPTLFLRQVTEEMEKGNIIKTNPIQVLLHILSLCAFPVLAKPMIKLATGADEEKFNLILEERKKEVVRFILNGLKT